MPLFSFRAHRDVIFVVLLLLAVAPAAMRGVAGAASSSCPRFAQTCIYVSPAGSDRDPGTAARPIRTLEHARDLVRRLDRSMWADILVVLENGTFRLNRPLALGPRDSGSNGHNVVWGAAQGATAIVSGGRRVTGWRVADAAAGIWAAKVPAGFATRQLYVNGVRAAMASGPVPVQLTKTRWGYTASSPLLASWRNPREIQFVYPAQLGQMAEPMCPVGSITGKTIAMAQPCWDNSTRRQALSKVNPAFDNDLVAAGSLKTPAYVQNAYPLLDQPGEFYVDSPAHVLYYIPRPGQNMPSADVEAPHLETLISGSGTPRQPIHNITFRGLQFSFATWLRPSTPEGFSEVQAGYTITGRGGVATEGLCRLAPGGSCPYGAWTKEPGNLTFTFDRNLTFLDDRFVYLGASALDLGNGSRFATVQGSVFTDISGNGIELGGVNMPAAHGAYQTLNNRILDNRLYGMPLEYHGGVPILVGYAAHTTISHNQIDHVAYSGISIGWGGWLAKVGRPAVANFSHDNLISDNRIFDFLQTLADGGGVYTLGITGPSLMRGEKVTGNVVHDRLGWGAGLKSDNATANVTYRGNALYNLIYDWDSNHLDGIYTPKVFPPETVTGNYWQEGNPDVTISGMTEVGNRIVSGYAQIPRPLRLGAGIQAPFRSITKWRPPGETVPDPPSRVSVLYTFGGKAIITWHPSLYDAGEGVTSYTVDACLVPASSAIPCQQPVAQSVTVNASALDRQGYAMIGGLTPGGAYAVSVIAGSPTGSSVPSIASKPFVVTGGDPPRPPDPPSHVWANSGRTAVTLQWYRPLGLPWIEGLSQRSGPRGLARPSRPSPSGPILGYVVTTPQGAVTNVRGHLQLIATNSGSKSLAVVSGLQPNTRYTFSVSAVNPGGFGSPALISVTTTR